MATTLKNGGTQLDIRPETGKLEIRSDLQDAYHDVYTPEVMAAMAHLARFDADRRELMSARIQRRADRNQNKQRDCILCYMSPHYQQY